MPTKEQAVSILLRNNEHDVAHTLAVWHNCHLENGGWDGWFRGKYPRLVPLLWSDDQREPDPAEEYARAFDAKCHP